MEKLERQGSELDLVREDFHNLNTKLQESEAIRNELEDRCRQLQEKNEQLTRSSNLEAVLSRLSEAGRPQDSDAVPENREHPLITANTALTKEVLDLRKETTELEDRLRVAMCAKASMLLEIDTLRLELRNKKVELKAIRERLGEKYEEVNRMEALTEMLHSEKDSLEDENVLLRGSVREAEDECASLLAEKDELSSKISRYWIFIRSMASYAEDNLSALEMIPKWRIFTRLAFLRWLVRSSCVERTREFLEGLETHEEQTELMPVSKQDRRFLYTRIAVCSLTMEVHSE